MAIQPISRMNSVSHVNFEGKPRHGKKSGGSNQQSSAMKAAVPVALFIAMSPLNQYAAAADYNNKIASLPRTEILTQAPQEPQKAKLYYRYTNFGDQYMRVWGVSDDDNPEDAEAFLFKYKRELGNNKIAVLGGQFLAVSNQPREDGRYLMLYYPLDTSGKLSEELELTYVPEEFKSLLFGASMNIPSNNHACGRAPISSFIRKCGRDAVENAPNIEDATNVVLNKKITKE